MTHDFYNPIITTTKALPLHTKYMYNDFLKYLFSVTSSMFPSPSLSCTVLQVTEHWDGTRLHRSMFPVAGLGATGKHGNVGTEMGMETETT